jgi:hypothetical protein
LPERELLAPAAGETVVLVVGLLALSGRLARATA